MRKTEIVFMRVNNLIVGFNSTIFAQLTTKTIKKKSPISFIVDSFRVVSHDFVSDLFYESFSSREFATDFGKLISLVSLEHIIAPRSFDDFSRIKIEIAVYIDLQRPNCVNLLFLIFLGCSELSPEKKLQQK